ncbi:trans-sialidase [Trypanosoma cruzi]|nr:trans-sialidase [Trypanosoma cruzi]
MSRRVFASAVLLLLVVMMCAAVGPVQAQNYGTREGDSSGRHSLERLPREYPVANTAAAGHIFLNPHLVNVDGMLLAIAGAQFNRTVGSGSASMQLMVGRIGSRTRGQKILTLLLHTLTGCRFPRLLDPSDRFLHLWRATTYGTGPEFGLPMSGEEVVWSLLFIFWRRGLDEAEVCR